MDRKSKNSHDENSLEGRYANYFKIGHNAFEFVLEFGQCHDDEKNAYMHSRIMISPAYIKEFFRIVQKSLKEYEENYGEITRTPKLNRVDNP